jgi:hypothetical protein
MLDELVYDTIVEQKIMEILHDVKIIGRYTKCVIYICWMALSLVMLVMTRMI